jgi:hypothetical protein
MGGTQKVDLEDFESFPLAFCLCAFAPLRGALKKAQASSACSQFPDCLVNAKMERERKGAKGTRMQKDGEMEDGKMDDAGWSLVSRDR